MRNALVDESMNEELNDCIEGLLAEDWAPQGIEVPDAPEERWQLFRRLCIERPAVKPDDMLQMDVDDLLDEVVDASGDVDPAELEVTREVAGGGKICLWKGDITTLRVHGLAHPTTPDLMGSFDASVESIDTDVIVTAGIGLRYDIKRALELPPMPGEPESDIIVTYAGKMPCFYLAHFPAMTDGDAEALEQRYRQVFELIERHDCRSAAFPVLGRAEDGYDLEVSAAAAVKVITEELASVPENRPLHTVVLAVETDEEYAAFAAALA